MSHEKRGGQTSDTVATLVEDFTSHGQDPSSILGDSTLQNVCREGPPPSGGGPSLHPTHPTTHPHTGATSTSSSTTPDTLASMTASIGDHETVDQWLNAMRIAHLGHITAAKQHASRHRLFGGIAAALGAISATAVFANIRENPRPWVQVLAGTVVLIAVCVGVIGTYLNYAASAAAHQSAATGYGSLRRELEQRRVVGTVDDAFLSDFRTEWNRLDRSSPTMPPKVYDAAFEKVTNRKP